MTEPAAPSLRDRQVELATASSVRRLQRQEDARRLIEEANELVTDHELADGDDGRAEA